MKRLLLRYILPLLVVGICGMQAMAQETYDQTNSPRQWYYNNLNSATAATVSTYFPNGASASVGSAVTLGTSSMFGGNTPCMTTTGSNAMGYIRWNFLANSATGSGTSLNNRPWEWEFDYKNVTGSFTYNPDSTLSTSGGGSAGMVAGKDSWRYWLMANTYGSATTTQGLYVTQVANTLKVIQKYGNNYNDSRVCASIPMPNNTNTYQIRCVRSITGYWNFYVYNRNTGATVTSLMVNITQTIQNNSYYLSYLEATSANSGRFQWDNFNFYQVRLDYVPITGDSGLTTAIYPGIVDAIPYAVNVNVRGDIQMGRLVVNFATNGGQALFTSGAIYKTTNSPIAIATSTPFVNSSNQSVASVAVSVNSTNTSQADMPASEYYYNSGNPADGSTVNVTNYFFVFQGRGPSFYSPYASAPTFSISPTADNNYSQFFGNSGEPNKNTPYSQNSSSSTSQPIVAGDLWDWTGANSTWTSTSNAWKKNGTVTTSNPGSSTDIVRIGVVAYSGGTNQPTVNATKGINQLIFGTNGSPSLTVASPLTTSDDIIFNTGSTATITNNNTITTNMDLLVNSSATVQINGTGGILIKGNFLNDVGATFTSTANTITFNGAAQSITNNNTTAPSTNAAVKFNNLSFSSSSGTTTKTFSGSGYTSIATTGILTLGTSVIISIPSSATHLQLLGNATAYAQIATIPSSSSIQGNIDYQVYFTAGLRGYRSMAAPVYEGSYNTSNGSYSLANLKNTFIITGVGGASAGFDASTNNGATLRTYNSATNNYTFVPLATTVPTGTGYYMYFRGNRTNVPAGTGTTADPFGTKTNKGTGSYFSPEAVTYTYTGVPNQQDVVKTFGTSDTYYYFLANPYAATLDLDAVVNSTDYTAVAFYGAYSYADNYINTSIWTWNPSLMTYGAYDHDTGLGTNQAKRYVLPGQGFFVKAKTNPTIAFGYLYASPNVLTLKESMKSTGNVTNTAKFLSTSIPVAEVAPPITRLQLYKNASVSDEVLIVFNDKAKDSLDRFDAPHLDGDFMNLTTITPDNGYLAIDKRPIAGTRTVVPLYFNFATDSIYSFKSTYNSPMMANYKVSLYDSLLNSYTDIVKNDYSFPVQRSQASTYGKRFKLIIEAQPAPNTYLDLSARFTTARQGLVNWKTNAYIAGTTYQVQRSMDNATFENMDLPRTGKEGFTNDSFDVVDKNVQLGKNYYRLVQTDIFGNKIISGSVMLNNNPNLTGTDKQNGFKLYPNPVGDNFSIMSEKSYSGKITLTIFRSNSEIIFTKTLTQLNAYEPVQEFVSQLRQGIYFVELKDANNKVLTTLKFIKI